MGLIEQLLKRMGKGWANVSGWGKMCVKPLRERERNRERKRENI